MGLFNTIINSFTNGKNNNSFNASNQFLRYGNTKPSLTPTWSGVKVTPEDAYRGYPYAAAQRKGNRVSAIAKRNLYIDVTPELLEEYQKLNKDPVHPYLKLIQESTDFSTKKFWKNISIYLDLCGRYYLGVVREPTGFGLSYIQKFVLLNPFEVKRVIDKNGEVAGYVEYKADGRRRHWQAHQIITFMEESPFDTSQAWSLVDAAKPAIYTLNQSADHTRQSLNGNLNAPGIITTDVLLDDGDFENFKARITSGTKGEPIFANGAGAVQWQDMQIDLNKAALLDINEINRSEFIAVAGASKTNLGIEQSGTTRETARVQDDNYIRDSIEPRVEDIIDVLNLDYRKNYPNEYERTGYTIELRSALSKDYDSEMKATELRNSQSALAQDLVEKGYTRESAVSYATGKSDLEDLVIDEDKLKAEEEARKAQEQAEKEAKEASTQEEKPTTENSPINIHIEAPKAPENKVVVQESDKQPVVNVSPVINIDNSTQETLKNADNNREEEEPDDQGWVGAELEAINVLDRLNNSGLDTSILTNVSDLLPETTNIPGQDNPHVTLVYGLKDKPYEIKDQILKIVEESGLKEVTIEKISHFPVDTGFALVALLKKSDELVKVHEDLLKLDHYTQKYPDYTPHMTLAYLDDMTINGNLVDPNEYYAPFEDLVGKTLKVQGIDLDKPDDDDGDIADIVIGNAYKNDITPDDIVKVNNAHNKLKEELLDVHQRILNVSLENITVNSFTQPDLMPTDISKDFATEIGDFLKEYWLYITPIFGLAMILKQPRIDIVKPETYVLSKSVREFIDKRAQTSGEGHLQTILNDILKASNKAYSDLMGKVAIDLIGEAYDRNPDKFKDYFTKKPTKKQIKKAIDTTDILEKNRKIYDKANKMALEGFARKDVINSIRKEFTEVSKNRATLIARHETSRAYVQAQYDADKQLLEVTGKLKNAYKQLYSRTGHPCAYCQELIDRGPVPFESNFLNKGDSIDIVENGKKYTFVADYEDIVGGAIHPNCYHKNTRVYTNQGWKHFYELNGDELFFSIDPETDKPEWVAAKKYIKYRYKGNLMRFYNKNVDMCVTPDHNLFLKFYSKSGSTYNKFVQAKDVSLSRQHRFYAGIDWKGSDPGLVKLGDKMVTPQQFTQFMGMYLSEGSCGLYKSANRVSIAQTKYRDEFRNMLSTLPYNAVEVQKGFEINDKPLVEYLLQFGKCNEKFVPQEIKDMKPEYIRMFLDAYILGDGHIKAKPVKGSEYIGVNRTIFTSSIRMRDDITELAVKAGYRPTIKIASHAGTIYQGTDYKTNYDVWTISLNNRVRSYADKVNKELVPYDDDVYCVELEKNHTLYTEYNGRIWWNGNCSCSYKLVIKNGEISNTYTREEGENLQKIINSCMNQGCDENCTHEHCTHEHNEIGSNNG